MINKKFSHLLWLIPSLIIIFIFTVFPLFKTLIDSFISGGELSVHNFSSIFNDTNFLISIRNSFILTIGSLFTVIIGVWISLMIVKITNRYVRDSFVTIIFLQYMFISMAIYTGYSFIFEGNYGFINSLIINNGGKGINFLNSSHNAIWTILIIESIKPIPFIVAILSYRFITYSSNNKNILRNDCVRNDSLFFSKVMIKNSLPLIFILLFYFSAENFLSYPVGLYSNDLTSMFIYHAQTLTAYINRSLDLNLYGNAAATSMVIIMIVSTLTIGCYVSYLFIKRRNK